MGRGNAAGTVRGVFTVDWNQPAPDGSLQGPADVADAAALGAALDAAAGFAPIDGLFCNAGMGGTFAPLEAYTDENFDALMAVNMVAHFRSVRHVFAGMKARGAGVIVNLGEVTGLRLSGLSYLWASDYVKARNAPFVEE